MGEADAIANGVLAEGGVGTCLGETVADWLRIGIEVEEQIVLLRKQLTEEGLDAGAVTIQWHLARHVEAVPSVSTIWRVLARRGFVAPQPHKRPRSSYIRFEADLPNECWQSDMTHWALVDGTGVETVHSSTTTAGCAWRRWRSR